MGKLERSVNWVHRTNAGPAGLLLRVGIWFIAGFFVLTGILGSLGVTTEPGKEQSVGVNIATAVIIFGLAALLIWLALSLHRTAKQTKADLARLPPKPRRMPEPHAAPVPQQRSRTPHTTPKSMQYLPEQPSRPPQPIPPTPPATEMRTADTAPVRLPAPEQLSAAPAASVEQSPAPTERQPPEQAATPRLSRRELRERERASDAASTDPASTLTSEPPVMAPSDAPAARAEHVEHKPVPQALTKRPKRARELEPYRLLWLSASEWANKEAAGAGFRKSSVIAAIGQNPRVDERVNAMVDIQLIPEPSNVHDHNAVKLMVGRHHVGYIEREDAAEYQPVLKALVDQGYAPTVRGKLSARRYQRYNWESERSTTEDYVDVEYQLDAPELITPTNTPPDYPYSILPYGTAVQVTEENQHMEALAPHIKPGGESRAIGTLHIATYHLKNGEPRQKIEVRIDDATIGYLSTQMSRHFIPTVTYLEQERDLIAAVIVIIKGSAIAAEATVKAAKASELPDSWLDGEPVTLPAIEV